VLRIAPIFVDTAAFQALVFIRSGNHEDATAILRRLERERWKLVTSSFVRADAHELLLGRAGGDLAVQFGDNLRAGAIGMLAARSLTKRGCDSSGSL
jgi:predicted nucleic acid-binding protein